MSIDRDWKVSKKHLKNIPSRLCNQTETSFYSHCDENQDFSVEMAFQFVHLLSILMDSLLDKIKNIPFLHLKVRRSKKRYTESKKTTCVVLQGGGG